MRVLIVSQYFPPENVYIPADLSRYLYARGHQVRVLTGFPNYPGGRIYTGFSQQWRAFETYDGIKVLRVPLYADHSASFLRRALNYLSFGLSSASAVKWAAGADVVYVYATQMTPALGPWLWRLTARIPFVLHIQDLWPDSIIGSSMVRHGRLARIVERFLTSWLRKVYRSASAVIGIAPSMVRTLEERGVPPDVLELVYNWSSSEGCILPANQTRIGGSDGGHIDVLYAGNVGDMQDLETIVWAMHKLNDPQLRLSIVGDGLALGRIKHLVARLGATGVSFRDFVPQSEVGPLYVAADYVLVTLKDLPTFRGTIPSKFQAALYHGIPVITTVQGDLRDLVEREGIGHTSDAECIDSLINALKKALSTENEEWLEMASRARSLYAAKFSSTVGLGRIESTLVTAAQLHSPRDAAMTT